jgi:hypothetical protein
MIVTSAFFKVVRVARETPAIRSRPWEDGAQKCRIGTASIPAPNSVGAILLPSNCCKYSEIGAKFSMLITTGKRRPIGFAGVCRKHRSRAERKAQSRRKAHMSELETPPQRSISGLMIGLVAAALVIALGGLVWSYILSGKLTRQQTALNEANEQNVKLAADLRETDARLKVTTQELGQSLGLTQKQLEEKSQEILVREQADNKRLESAQRAASQQITAVSSDVSAVKTDVGGVKTDVAKTQSDLATAVGQLTSMQGDISGHTSLIARNHDELEILKHKGDRT